MSASPDVLGLALYEVVSEIVCDFYKWQGTFWRVYLQLSLILEIEFCYSLCDVAFSAQENRADAW